MFSCKQHVKPIFVPKYAAPDFFKTPVPCNPRTLALTPLVHSSDGDHHTYSTASGKMKVLIFQNQYAVVAFTQEVFSNMCQGGKAAPVYEQLGDGAMRQIGEFEYYCVERLFQCAKAAEFNDAAAFTEVLNSTSVGAVKKATNPGGPTGGVKDFMKAPWDIVSPKFMTWFQFHKFTNPELFAFLQEVFALVKTHGVVTSRISFVEVSPWGDAIWGVSTTMEQFCDAVRAATPQEVISGSVYGGSQNLLGASLTIAARFILRAASPYEQYCAEVLSHPVFIIGGGDEDDSRPATPASPTGRSNSPVVPTEPRLNDSGIYEGSTLGYAVALPGSYSPTPPGYTIYSPSPVHGSRARGSSVGPEQSGEHYRRPRSPASPQYSRTSPDFTDDGESYQPLARTASDASDDRPSYQPLDPVSGFIFFLFSLFFISILTGILFGQGDDSDDGACVNRTLSPCYGVGAGRVVPPTFFVASRTLSAAPVGRTLSSDAAPMDRTGSWSPTPAPSTIVVGNRMAPRPIVAPGAAVKPGFALVEDTVEPGSGAAAGTWSGSGAAAGTWSGSGAAAGWVGIHAGSAFTTPPTTPVRLAAAGAVPPNYGRMLRDAKRPRTANSPPPVVLPPPVIIDLACEEEMPQKP